MPRIGDDDQFEQNYMAKLRLYLTEVGVLVEYPLDRAAIDVGVHLWVDSEGQDEVVGARIWFQAKGFHSTTIPTDVYEAAEAITTPPLPIDQVSYWYSAPEPVYLVLFVESVDTFLAVDVRDLVDRRGGLKNIADADQKTVSFRIPKTETLTAALKAMPRHRSMRIDGPAWRGRPLGHGFDPLRSALAPMAPGMFADLVSGILSAHDFRQIERKRSIRELLSEDKPTVFAGRMHLTYEWILPMTTEFGMDEGSDFRIEGEPFNVQGDVLVIVDPIGSASPKSLGVHVSKLCRESSINRVLVFANTQFTPAQFGGWFAGLRDSDLICYPQDLGSFTFNVLTTTNVFLDYHDRLELALVNYLD